MYNIIHMVYNLAQLLKNWNDYKVSVIDNNLLHLR